MMHKKLFVIALSILSVIIILGLLVGGIALKGTAEDKKCKQYVDQILPEILETMSKDVLYKYSTNELINSVTEEELDRMLIWFERKLGDYKIYHGAKGQVMFSMMSGQGNKKTGHYQAKVDFENGPATVIVSLVEKETEWLLTNFKIDSKLLIPVE